MDAASYQDFTQRLQTNLSQDPRVLGLVALGSMAQQDYQPDRWSDHDFFVITVPQMQEELRSDLNWLPDFEQIALRFRETQHGLKIIYNNGHLLEFAVFDLKELYLAKVNRYRILLDQPGANLTEHLAKIKAASVTPQLETAAQALQDFNDFGQFVSNLLVGVGRYNRGEQLSGHQYVKGYALRHLLVLLQKYVAAPNKELLDNLDPLRRFEKVYSELSLEINAALAKPVPQAALALLDIADAALKDRLANYPAAGVAAVRQQL